jgi:NAD(P)-dependent dehydrogenase (short-subunit alcohol dehydrogenase family)
MSGDTAMTPARIAVVTGASAGIGRATALRLATRGMTVVAVARSQEQLETLAAAHAAIHPLRLDVSDSAACAAAFADIAGRIGPVDVLVAAAAVYPRAHFLDQTAADFSATMRINIDGVANAIRELLPGMLVRGWGRVVVVGSMADQRPLPGSAAYSVSKGALHPLVKGIAAEIDPVRYPDVLINELTPGATQTAMSRAGKSPDAASRLIEKLIDLPRGAPSGKFFVEDRMIELNKSLKSILRQLVSRRYRS